MKTSRFVCLFLVVGFVFLFFYNVVILSDMRLLPQSGVSFRNIESLDGWRFIASILLYPAKMIMVGPILPVLDLPYPPSPYKVIAFTFYWTVLALAIQYLIEVTGYREAD